MGKQNHSMTVGDMAVLAGSVGLVAADRAGQQAFLGWWNQDEKAARAALFGRVAARRLAASKGKQPRWLLRKQAVAAGQTFHATSPATIAQMNRKDAVAAALAAQPAPAAAPAPGPAEYPANWSRPARSAAASVRAANAAGAQLAVVEPQYPAGWLAATGHVRRTGGVAVIEAND